MISDLKSLSKIISAIYQRHRSHLLINGDDISRKVELLRTNITNGTKICRPRQGSMIAMGCDTLLDEDSRLPESAEICENN